VRETVINGLGFVVAIAGCVVGMLSFGVLVSRVIGGFGRVRLFLGGHLGQASLGEMLAIVVGGAGGLAAGIGSWIALVRRRALLSEAEVLSFLSRK
jgi:hypothetical protein